MIMNSVTSRPAPPFRTSVANPSSCAMRCHLPNAKFVVTRRGPQDDRGPPALVPSLILFRRHVLALHLYARGKRHDIVIRGDRFGKSYFHRRRKLNPSCSSATSMGMAVSDRLLIPPITGVTVRTQSVRSTECSRSIARPLTLLAP